MGQVGPAIKFTNIVAWMSGFCGEKVGHSIEWNGYPDAVKCTLWCREVQPTHMATLNQIHNQPSQYHPAPTKHQPAPTSTNQHQLVPASTSQYLPAPTSTSQY